MADLDRVDDSAVATFKTFAITGGLTTDYTPVSANLGAFIARALKREGAVEVRILGRGKAAMSSPIASEMRALGVLPISVDYDSPDTLVAALKGVDVAISTLSGPALRGEAQFELAKACKDAGVQLFVPSEFGTATNRVPPSSVLYSKQAFVNRVEAELPGLKTLRIFNGAFADKANPLAITDENNEVHITGTGLSPMSFTSRASVAGFLAYILTHLPCKDLCAYGHLPIESSRTTLLSLAHILQARNLAARIIHDPVPAEDEIAKGDFVGFMRWFWESGGAVVTEDAGEVMNRLWVGGEWKRVEDLI